MGSVAWAVVQAFHRRLGHFESRTPPWRHPFASAHLPACAAHPDMHNSAAIMVYACMKSVRGQLHMRAWGWPKLKHRQQLGYSSSAGPEAETSKPELFCRAELPRADTVSCFTPPQPPPQGPTQHACTHAHAQYCTIHNPSPRVAGSELRQRTGHLVKHSDLSGTLSDNTKGVISIMHGRPTMAT